MNDKTEVALLISIFYPETNLEVSTSVKVPIFVAKALLERSEKNGNTVSEEVLGYIIRYLKKDPEQEAKPVEAITENQVEKTEEAAVPDQNKETGENPAKKIEESRKEGEV